MKKKNLKRNLRESNSSEQSSLKKRKIAIDEPPKEPIIECCVCMMTDLDGLIILVDDEYPTQSNGLPPIATLSDCDPDINLTGTIFYCPCREHAVCCKCLRNIAMNFDNHPIGSKQSFISCPYPFGEGCESFNGLPYYFSHTDIQKVLTVDEYQMYMNHSERFQFPGYEIVKCPRPVLLNRGGGDLDNQISMCGAWILVPHSIVKSVKPGNLILECDQNRDCLRRSCYHCHSIVRRTLQPLFQVNDDDGLFGRVYTSGECDTCLTSTENSNPQSFNKYFYNPDKTAKDGKPLFFRNEELTPQIVLTQLEEIASNENMNTRCFECLTVIYKTEQCNAITHCGIERCYACGRCSNPDIDLGDHWDSVGLKGCPRFDHSNFWNEIGDCKFECYEGQCYSDAIGLCNIEAHQRGVKNMITKRKRAHIYHAIKSLLPSQREYILSEAYKNRLIKPYLPVNSCSEYRCYLPDAIIDKINSLNDVTENTSNTYTSYTQERLLEYKQQLECKILDMKLKFTEIVYNNEIVEISATNITSRDV